MKITIAAIGKMKKSPELEILENYKKRIPWAIEIKEYEEKKGLGGDKLKAKEGEALLNIAGDKSVKIVLDEQGKDLTSVELANKIQKFAENGRSEFVFMIGGAAGHSEDVKNKADLKLSMGKKTWPHMLCRAMLMEQIYRCYTIMSNHPYHKG